MDMVKKYFPQAFNANDVKSLIIALLIYAVLAVVGGFIIGLLGIIPIIGFIAGILGWLLEIYCTIGVILAILVFLKIVK
ncbi:MAG: hypothetical protein IKA09_06505 [Lachnospiraceae bacterium]|nr:hypothetical protein [Lachnospiraceae bacterium]